MTIKIPNIITQKLSMLISTLPSGIEADVCYRTQAPAGTQPSINTPTHVYIYITNMDDFGGRWEYSMIELAETSDDDILVSAAEMGAYAADKMELDHLVAKLTDKNKCNVTPCNVIPSAHTNTRLINKATPATPATPCNVTPSAHTNFREHIAICPY